MDIEKNLYKKVFVEPLKSQQFFETAKKRFYAKPTWKKWKSVFEDYNVYYGLSDSRIFNPQYANFCTHKIDITDTPFNSPLYNLDILDFFSDKYVDRYKEDQLAYLRLRTLKIVTILCDIIFNDVANPVPIFTGNDIRDPKYLRIHPFMCLTSAHSILNKPLKTIVFEKKKNFVGPKILLSNKTQLYSLQDILSYYENIPFGFMEIEQGHVSHIHLWCFVNGWDGLTAQGYSTYPKFDIKKFIEISKKENDIMTIVKRGYNECREA